MKTSSSLPCILAALFTLRGDTFQPAVLRPTDRSSKVRCIHEGLPCRQRRISLHKIRTSVLYANTPTFSNKFERWRFLQDLLDGDIDDRVINCLLYKVLELYLKNSPSQSFEDDISGSPELTPDLIARLERALEVSDEESLAIMGENSSEDVLHRLEALLPDPIVEEDANRSAWDTVMEIHGRDLVQANETNPTSEWQRLCLVARLLIHFDFLSKETPYSE